MKFSLHDDLIMERLVLFDTDLAKEVSNTPQWIESRVFIANLTINGVIVPARVFEECLRELYNSNEAELRHKYDADNFDARVNEAAQKLIDETADVLVEAMRDLTEVLEDSGNLIKPYWERGQ